MKNKRHKNLKAELKECHLATKFALLASEEILIPASSYFESKLCKDTIDEYKVLFGAGNIWLVAKAYNYTEYFESNIEEYVPNSLPHKTYSSLIHQAGEYPPLRTRRKKATDDIITQWNNLIEFTDKPNQIVKDLKLIVKPSVFEKNWQQIPDKLENLAFVVEHVRPLLFKEQENQIKATNALYSLINEFYFKSFTDEYLAGVIHDLVYLNAPFLLHSSGTSISYKKLLFHSKRLKFLDEIKRTKPSEIPTLKTSPVWLEILSNSLT